MSRKRKNVLLIVLIFILLITNCLTIYFGVKNSKDDIMMQDDNMMLMPEDNVNMDEKLDKPEDDMNMEEKLDKPEDNKPLEMPNDNGMMGKSLNISFLYYVLFAMQSIGLALLIMYLVISKFNSKSLKETFVSRDKIIIYVLSITIISVILFIGDIYLTRYFVSKTHGGMIEDMNNDISYLGAYEINESTEISGGECISSNIDENVILVNGKIDVQIDGTKIEKIGDSSLGDNTSFYGINSAVIAKDGANLTLKNLNIVTDATGANGVFSYGGNSSMNNIKADGTVINISDSVITTLKDNSGGIMTTGGGTTNANNLTITTSGVSSAAIRSDRGGGVVNVDGGEYTTFGSGSPSVYSTAEIMVKNATLTSEVSEGIIIEGGNEVTIDNCTLTSSNTKLNGLSTTYKNIFLYQSMSGDASSGTSSFNANNSKIITNNGDTFYVTNTTSLISLNNNTIINNDSNGNFLRVKADSWGNEGSNGGEVTLNFVNQKATGNIVVDDLSTLEMEMSDSSYYQGAINTDNSAKSISLKLDKTSSIKLTGDSYITSLDNMDNSNMNIDFNGYKLYVNGKAIN